MTASRYREGMVFVVDRHRRRRQGGWGAAALPTLEKFLKINHNRAENRPKVGQNLRKQWIFYRAAPLNFISPYAYVDRVIYIIQLDKTICISLKTVTGVQLSIVGSLFTLIC